MKWWKQKKFWLILLLIIGLIIGALAWFKGGDSGIETVAVKRQDLRQLVSLTGRVESARKVDLALEQSGRVLSLPYQVGDTVSAGALLVGLETATLAAELKAARARLALEQTDQQNTEVSLDQVTEQQATLVKNAYRDLLSTDLAAVPTQDNYGASAPLISGLYDGPEGRYKIIIRTGANFNQKDYRLFVFDLETVRDVRISTTQATALGTRGLFLTFPDELQNYAETIWYVDVPNKKSNSYLANYNTYQSALRNQERAIEEAQATSVSRPTGTINQAKLAVAQAEIDQLLAEISQRQLRAPFTGVLTKLETELGQTLSGGVVVASLISTANNHYQIETPVPEVDIAKIKIGDHGEVTLDAYGDQTTFDVAVSKIDPAEDIIEGVPTYLVTLNFLDADERIRSGMTANIELVTAEKENVLVIPARAVTTDDDKQLVRILIAEKLVTRRVETGLRDASGNIEITHGLKVGDQVVVYVPNNSQ